MKARWRTPLCTGPGWLACTLLVATGAQADPMRPLVPPPAASAARPSAAPAPGASAAPASAPVMERETPRLVAIRQDSEQRWQALFGERWLGVGDKLDGATVAHIDSNLVQLLEGRQRRSLHLLPPLNRALKPTTP